VETDDNLITGTDLFSTISEIAGINTDQYYDSKSFKALFSMISIIRNYQYSELNNGSNDSWAISNGVYKLIVNDTWSKELYNIVLDPYEQNNLLSGVLSPIEENAKSDLEAELNNIRQ